MQRQLIPTHYSPEMLWLIVEENSFHFNEKHYLQTHGTAVGTKTTVSFANIFMAYIETTLSRTVFKPTVWKCYINDISPYGTYVNPTIKFTAETSNTETVFLDTVVYKDTRFREKSIVDAKTHFKQAETFLHTHISPLVTLQVLKKDLSKE